MAFMQVDTEGGSYSGTVADVADMFHARPIVGVFPAVMVRCPLYPLKYITTYMYVFTSTNSQPIKLRVMNTRSISHASCRFSQSRKNGYGTGMTYEKNSFS